jgi:hypothetical protein
MPFLECPDGSRLQPRQAEHMAQNLPPAFGLFVSAYRELLIFDWFVTRGKFEELYVRVRKCPIRKAIFGPNVVARICSAIDHASIWYSKPILCLQRSAATACLLKRHGIPAEMVIGVQTTPFKAHAWVEVEGRVVSDKPYVSAFYAVLDHC